MRVQAPKAGAAEILQRRFPVPRLVDCDQNGSQVCMPKTPACLPVHVRCSRGQASSMKRLVGLSSKTFEGEIHFKISTGAAPDQGCGCVRRRASCLRG